MDKPKTAPAFSLPEENHTSGYQNDLDAEYFDWELSDPLAMLGLPHDNVMFQHNGHLIDAHERNLYYQHAHTVTSVDTVLRFLRKKFGIALNVMAHDGDYYTVEPVYLSNATEGFQTKLDVNARYDSYEAAAKESIGIVIAELLERMVQKIMPGARLVASDELVRLFGQIRERNVPKRPK